VALRALLRTSAWHLLVFAGSTHAISQDQITAETTSLPAWLEKVTIIGSRLDDLQGLWDADGRVRHTLAATDGDWILVRPDGYLSARGTGETSLRAALARLSGLHMR
ncbi:2-polyprenyl-6-methoxyphenol hydroxylase, partial [Georgenia ruanii]|nr:2-polyprenyl-6-methoxyphenol hydroxylase [Georgenia ruanii]